MLSLTEESEYRSAVLKQLQQKVAGMAARHEELHRRWKQLCQSAVRLRALADDLAVALRGLVDVHDSSVYRPHSRWDDALQRANEVLLRYQKEVGDAGT